MSINAKSDVFNPIGIFGILDPKQEKYLRKLQNTYGEVDGQDGEQPVFNHLSIVINNEVHISEVFQYIDLLRELRTYLPLKIPVKGLVEKDEDTIACSFEVSTTEDVRSKTSKLFPDGIVVTDYMKVVRHVPKNKQDEVIENLKSITELIIVNFVLVANKLDTEHILYTSNGFR